MSSLNCSKWAVWSGSAIGPDTVFFVFFSKWKLLIIFLFPDRNICCGYTLEALLWPGWSESVLGVHVRMYIFSGCGSVFFIKTYVLGTHKKCLKNICIVGTNLLAMLNKLRCHAHFLFSANQITWSRLLIQIPLLDDKQCRSRSVGFFRSQLIWIYTVCKGRVYLDSAILMSPTASGASLFSWETKGIWQTVQIQIRYHRIQHLIRVYTVCIRYRNFVKHSNNKN